VGCLIFRVSVIADDTVKGEPDLTFVFARVQFIVESHSVYPESSCPPRF
jgi:hypothetical protein